MANEPEKSHREGISVIEMSRMFATEADAVAFFESLHWPDGNLTCLRCGTRRPARGRSGSTRRSSTPPGSTSGVWRARPCTMGWTESLRSMLKRAHGT